MDSKNFIGHLGTPQKGWPLRASQNLYFQMTDRFLSGVDEVMGETIPHGIKTLVDAPIEVADHGVIEAAKEVSEAARAALSTVGGVVAEVITPPAKAVEAVLVTMATPMYEVVRGLKEATWDTARNLGSGEAIAAGKSFLHGLIWRPIRAVGRTLGNAIKGTANTAITTVRSAFRATQKVIGIETDGEGFKTTGSGIVSIGSSLAFGVGKLVTSIGKTTLFQSLKGLWKRKDNSDALDRFPMSITGAPATASVEPVLATTTSAESIESAPEAEATREDSGSSAANVPAETTNEPAQRAAANPVA